MSIRTNFKHTTIACYIGYITQAIAGSFLPLLFVTIQQDYHVSLSQISFLVMLNFGVQLLVDLISTKFLDFIGYRIAIVAAHIFAAVGFLALGILPKLLLHPFSGICIAVILYAVGGGLIEVLVSPIVEACPNDRKTAAMSILHSFYCWGCVLVILLSTLFFTLFGMENWWILSILWAMIPLFNAAYFSKVPIRTLVEDGEGMSLGTLIRMKLFWLFVLLMLCAGAAEQAMSQWASAFAESGLQVSKTAGDLAGPCGFAVLMGISRVLQAKLSKKIPLTVYLYISDALCVGSYLLATLLPNAILSLCGCILCGFSVGAMWPGTFRLASESCPKGGTALFALLALAGDCGCSSGPMMVGIISEAFGNHLKIGLFVAVLFPLLFLVGIYFCRKWRNSCESETTRIGS